MKHKILDMLHLRSGTLLVGLALVLLGVVMIFCNITDKGELSLIAENVRGTVKTGLVGVTFAFLGTFIILVNTLRAPAIHKIKIKKGDSSIEWEGPTNSTSKLFARIDELVGTISDKKQA